MNAVDARSSLATLVSPRHEEFEAWLAGQLSMRLCEIRRRSREGIATVLPDYQPWVTESIRILREYCYGVAGDADAHGGSPCASASASDPQASWRYDPDLDCQASIAERMLDSLLEIVTGMLHPTQALFSTADRIERHYRFNRLLVHCNERLADLLTDYIDHRLAAGRAGVRILEVGAGFGGTTGVLLRRLEPYAGHVAAYSYTDVASAFLVHGRRTFGPAYPYLEFLRYDAARPIAEQRIAAGTVDVVVAANALHATRDIRQTLFNVKALLAPGGILLLNEMTGASLFTHCTFGLLSEWWAHEDGDLRLPGCPGLAPDRWREVLERVGFRPVTFAAESLHILGLQAICAVNARPEAVSLGLELEEVDHG